MSNNANCNFLKNQNQKLLDTERRLLEEGIIFKRRILINIKDNNNDIKDNNNKDIKRNTHHKNLSIKLTDKYISNEKKINNNHINSLRTKKKSFSKNNYLSINEFREYGIKKCDNLKTNINNIFNNKINCKNKNYDNKINLKYNNYKKYKNNTQRKSLNKNDFDMGILPYENLSPRISYIKLEKGHISPIERTKYYRNNNKDKDKGYKNLKFNYKKWNKIIINNIFDKDKNDKMNEKENNGLIYNQNDIYINDNGIQEIIIPNINKAKRIKGNNIPYTNAKYNNITNTNHSINKNNKKNSFNKIPNLVLSKENKKNFSREILNELKFEKNTKSPEIKNKYKINNNSMTFKSYKSDNKKLDSFEGIIIDNKPKRKKNIKISLKNKNISNKILNSINNIKKKDNKYNLENNNQNNNIYRNDFYKFK